MLLVDVELKTTATERDNGYSRQRYSGPRYWSLDVVVHPHERATASIDGEDDRQHSRTALDLRVSGCPPFVFLEESIAAIRDAQRPGAMRFIFPAEDGHVTRSDFLERRLEYCECAAKVASFTPPLQALSGEALREVEPSGLSEILPRAIGGVLLRTSDSTSLTAALGELDVALRNRLSFPWMLPEPLRRRRVAWVQGREDINVSRRAYESARALGISIVMIENAGHWLEDDNGPYAHLREAFIPVDIGVDAAFTQRIVDAVRSYPHPVDGLMTISDVRLPGVAKACEILGLPTSPHDAYAIAGDKGRTRMTEKDADSSVVLPSAEDLPDWLSSRRDELPPFPLIVKPCLGWNSDCVSKVSNEDELAEAVRRASQRHADAAEPSTAVVVEPYVDGPEVDANFVLLDGEVLFMDVSDDFPSRGDARGADLDDDFQETQVVMPTALPRKEVAVLRDSLRDSVLRQGFVSGVFHCEARVRRSRMRYAKQRGILDLKEKADPPLQDAGAYLLENNARPPGYLESVAVDLTHGVDYYALRLLLSVGPEEKARVRALARPFTRGAQFHLSIMIVPQTRAGVMKTADAGAEFLRQHPDLRDQITHYDTQMKGGAVLEGPSAKSLWWIAYFCVFSRVDRRDCLRLVQFIEDNFTYELDEGRPS